VTFDIGELDPEQCEYGAATPPVRTILRTWLAIDWLAPAAATDAAALFAGHHACARAHAPELFPDGLKISSVRGGWPEFAELCTRVRAPDAFDWKYGAIKRLSHEHSRRHGLQLRDHPACIDIASGVLPGPGALFFRWNEAVIWRGLDPRLDRLTGRAGLDRDADLARPHADAIRWYISYAQMDVLAAIEWQLAERSDSLDGNPYAPLIDCYRAGHYPFGLGPHEVALFALRR
jgi:hypothetical protein